MPEQTEANSQGDSTVRKPRSPAKVLKYAVPDEDKFGGKGVVRLIQSDILVGNLQVVRDGGDTNLHSHAGMDGFWFVLKGMARFYGPGKDQVIAEVGVHQGVFIPRNFPYWFETIGDEQLEILQVEAIDRSVRNLRTDYDAVTASTQDVAIFNMEGKLLSRGKL
jgi:mannose-6-phosphate isomerase-like protein (cupin superfamily)